MIKYLIFSIILVATHSQLWAKKVDGFVQSGTQKLPGIVVTDGINFTQSNADGYYQFEVSEKADFVYIFTPSGYSAPFGNGSPQFYQSLKEASSDITFDLEKLPYTSVDYALLSIADPQTKNMEQFARFERESIIDLQTSISGYKEKKINTIGIALGDIAWDELELFSNFKQAISALKIPFYAVIGNHDHDLNCSDDYASTEVYRKQFGPTDYGFNLGKQHYIVLDDIVYKGNKSYDEDLTNEQLEWVKKYLQFIPKGSELVFAIHAPFKNIQADKIIPHGQQLLDICIDYKLSFISGHTHLNSNFEVAPNVIEHNIGAICGTWWTAETCRDGTPNGYQVFEGSQDQLSWLYKSVGKGRDYQLAVYDKGSVVNQANAVVAKIWNWDPQWKVEWFEDGKSRGNMKQFSAYAPDYLRYLQNRNEKGKKEVAGYKQSVKSFFYFAAYPSLKAQKVKVVATDRFGISYEHEIALHSVDVEAHRGGAGLMPENTIESMLNSVRLGANTMELDLHITKDMQVIVAHDAHLNAGFTTKPDGSGLTDEDAAKLTFYRLTFDEISKYDTGSKPYKKFPEQQKQVTHIPLVSALIDSVENYVATHKLSPVFYNIEIKSDKKLEDKKLIPDYKTFADEAMKVLLRKNLGERLLVQSFDTRTLNYLHERYPETQLVYLVENLNGFEGNMAKLNFIPTVYSPYHKLVSQKLIDTCKNAGVKVIPWTVDDEDAIQKMLDMKVDGIISNYPDRVLKLTRGY